MNTDKLFRVLSKISPLPNDFKEALKKELHFIAYPRGYYLVQEDAPVHHTYFLEKGFCVSYNYQGTKKIVTGFWQKGEIILSPKSFFAQTPSDEIIELTTDCELLRISYSSVNKLFERFAVANFLARIIVADYHARCREEIIDLHYLEAWERYSKLIGSYSRIELNVPQDLIASYLNVTPQSLCRLKNEYN